jgi:hypothetical protein
MSVLHLLRSRRQSSERTPTRQKADKDGMDKQLARRSIPETSLGWEKDTYRLSITDLSLEGIMQCKQFEMLSHLMIFRLYWEFT